MTSTSSPKVSQPAMDPLSDGGLGTRLAVVGFRARNGQVLMVLVAVAVWLLGCWVAAARASSIIFIKGATFG
ncbi:MAG: hypothetical protein JO363_14055 [Solirubrobacterales bacterium]|nr:hypothetical protein [Solirubrobacterales bacterium]